MKALHLAIALASASIFFSSSPPAEATDRASPALSDLSLWPGDALVSSDGRFRLAFQHDGNLVLLQGSTPIWSSKTSIPEYVPQYIPGPVLPLDYPGWTGGTTMVRNPYSPSRAIFQGDGNLVVYARYAGKEVGVWSSKTANNYGAVLYVQDDGNVVIYTSAGRAIWATNTCCR